MLLHINNVGTQEARVLSLFSKNPKVKLGPSEVWNLVAPGSRTPLTSIRRAISELVASGHVIKLDETRLSPWRKHEHLYTINNVSA
jgi:hypothetical protein